MPDICPHCRASFASPTLLLRHTKKVHPSPAPVARPSDPRLPESVLPCALCGLTFTSREARERHILQPHWRQSRSSGEPTSYVFS